MAFAGPGERDLCRAKRVYPPDGAKGREGGDEARVLEASSTVHSLGTLPNVRFHDWTHRRDTCCQHDDEEKRERRRNTLHPERQAKPPCRRLRVPSSEGPGGFCSFCRPHRLHRAVRARATGVSYGKTEHLYEYQLE